MAGIKSCFRDGRHGELGSEEHVVQAHGGGFPLEVFKGVEITAVFPDKNDTGHTFVRIRRLRGDDSGEISGTGMFHLPEETAAAAEHINVFRLNRPHEVIHAVIAGFELNARDVRSDPLRHLRKQSILVVNMGCEAVLSAKTHHAETDSSNNRRCSRHCSFVGV